MPRRGMMLEMVEIDGAWRARRPNSLRHAEASEILRRARRRALWISVPMGACAYMFMFAAFDAAGADIGAAAVTAVVALAFLRHGPSVPTYEQALARTDEWA